MGPGDRLELIDGSGFIFRAYHALPALTRKSDGLPVGAVAGFCNMLQKILEARAANDAEAPTHAAVIFDYSARTFRNDIYPEYKAHRPEGQWAWRVSRVSSRCRAGASSGRAGGGTGRGAGA